ncbi:AAA family ATPase [Caenimonas sp. SL110]|uniref:AAA family ATPase n=1 Tax=Caenimonas sp. SL110 TaxID=1450524 RepID=UPI00069D504F|nr:AAA family ATPase [Caenimonas sp. SL110]
MRHQPLDRSALEDARHGTRGRATVVRKVRKPLDDAGKPVVLKQFLGVHAGNLCRHEAFILARLSHLEGVARLAGPQETDHQLALHNCGGQALAELIETRSFTPDAVVRFACQLARILADVHGAGVVHRNINPDAIVLSPDGVAVLTDFEFADLAEHHAGDAAAGDMSATVPYLAPEQTGRTGNAVGTRADLYCLGTLLYRMATGRLPFMAPDPLQFIHELLVVDPVAPSQLDAGIPAGLSLIILRLLAKSPARRYQSAEGLLHDLLRLAAEMDHGDGVFVLGDRDFPARLVAPARAIGRGDQLAVLRAAFDQARLGRGHTLLVEGPAGVGKTALIDELRAVAARSGGWFVQGKFDQYQKDSATAGALTQALRALGQLLLALPHDDLLLQRARIVKRLGPGAGLITRLLPEFAVLLGPQPEAPEVDLRQAELQLQEATLSLLLAVASRERPVVLALDDLQWAAALHLRSFERLMMEPGLEGLLLVGACRSGDARSGDALWLMLDKWRERSAPITRVPVTNLAVPQLGEMVGQMLRLDEQPAQDLAGELHAITGGNPLDTVELLNALRRDGVLRLLESGWHWAELAIRQFVGRGNVVDLLAVRVGRLPPASREVIECMSCLGNSIEMALLEAAMGQPGQVLRERMAAPMDDGLLVEIASGAGPAFAFRHDRVQQAVMDAMGEARVLHWRSLIARKLSRTQSFGEPAAQQYLECAHLLDIQEERLQAARLLVALGVKLAHTADYTLADRYLSTADALVSDAGDALDHELRLAIDTGRHAVLYPLGRLDEADLLFEAMQTSSAEPLALVDATCRQMRSLDVRGRMEDAKALGLLMLGRLGLHAPPGFLTDDTDQRLDALQQWVREDQQLDPASRQQMQDRGLLAVAKLLGRTVRSALVRFDADAIVWLLLESHRLWVTHGPCPELVANLGRMSAMLIALRGNHKAAYEFSRHILSVGEALGYEQQSSEARFVFVTYAAHWFEPLETVFQDGKRAYEEIRARGDASYACFVHMNMILTQLEMAPTAEVCLLEVESGIALCHRTGNKLAHMHHLGERQLLRALQGQTRSATSFDDAQYDEQAMLPLIESLPNLEQTHRACRAVNGLLMGDASVLIANANRAVAITRSITGYYLTTYAYLTGAVARAWELRQALATPGQDMAAIEAGLAHCRQWLAARAADQPYNFMHLLALVDAESAWARGDMNAAVETFDRALVLAQTRQRPWHCALITERAGIFHLEAGLQYTGRKLLAEARDRYERWGASAKVARMVSEHAFLRSEEDSQDRWGGQNLSQGSDGSALSGEALDLLGLLRASQALSSERSLPALIARVVRVLQALSGATQVRVLSWHDDGWRLLGADDAAPASGSITAAQGVVPMSAVTYVERTGETVLVDDACSDDRFARDPYFNGVLVCSLLVMPIASQGTAQAMLVLENRQGRAAFSARRLDAVMLIAGQLAVSLSNVQLYEQLEARVRSRTHELELMQAQLMDTARRAGKAEIANNVLHNVGNLLNSITVLASVVRKALAESRSASLSQAVGLLKQHQRDLGAFLESDPAGQLLLPYLDQVVAAIDDERQDVVKDLDRLILSVDHITNVLARQQLHAGPSSVVEPVLPDEIVSEALVVCGQMIRESDVAVGVDDSGTPALTVDRQRILLILMNLIRNAVQAMAGTPRAARRLQLKCSLAEAHHDGPSGQASLCFEVSDTGEGIADEHLERLFAHGFSTRRGGHGFGLHSSAIAAMEMGGRLSVHSEGPGRGATFTLEVPVTTPTLGLPGS